MPSSVENASQITFPIFNFRNTTAAGIVSDMGQPLEYGMEKEYHENPFEDEMDSPSTSILVWKEPQYLMA